LRGRRQNPTISNATLIAASTLTFDASVRLIGGHSARIDEVDRILPNYTVVWLDSDGLVIPRFSVDVFLIRLLRVACFAPVRTLEPRQSSF